MRARDSQSLLVNILEHQNCAPDISVARYKLSRLDDDDGDGGGGGGDDDDGGVMMMMMMVMMTMTMMVV